MAGINKVTLVGHLGNNPEAPATSQPCSKFSVATSESYLRNGERITQTTWHKVICWGALANVANEYLKKGDLVGIIGKIINRSYQDASNNTRYVTEIQAKELHMFGGRQRVATEETGASAEKKIRKEPEGPLTESELDDKIPF